MIDITIFFYFTSFYIIYGNKFNNYKSFDITFTNISTLLKIIILKEIENIIMILS